MKSFDELYSELCELSKELHPYYDIDKIKPYSVYVWTKDIKNEDNSTNVFDIIADEIVFYEEHEIIEVSKPIIAKIQAKLREIEIIK